MAQKNFAGIARILFDRHYDTVEKQALVFDRLESQLVSVPNESKNNAFKNLNCERKLSAEICEHMRALPLLELNGKNGDKRLCAENAFDIDQNHLINIIQVKSKCWKEAILKGLEETQRTNGKFVNKICGECLQKIVHILKQNRFSTFANFYKLYYLLKPKINNTSTN